MRLFLAGDFDPLFLDLHKRDPSFRPTPRPTDDDPRDKRALRAQSVLSRTHSIGGAARCLSAPLGGSAPPTSHAATFAKLNPSVGDEAPPLPAPHPKLPTTPCPAGGDVPPTPSQHSPRLRRPLHTHIGPDPPPIVLLCATVVKQARSLNCASAGGLSGSTNKSLRVWFQDHDPTSEALTEVLNLLAAGRVPLVVVNLLNAGRGVTVPKSEDGDVRPIVVGHVIMRLLGGLALKAVSPGVISFFLQPKALQFGISVAGGCELMAAAIRAHLESHPSHIDISCDAKNAFNSYCRSCMWGPLRARFPSLFSLARVMYGYPASIIFPEPGADIEEVLNTVGSRQGCTWGSFLYCLSIQGILEKLSKEFPDLLILAYCDDVHIVGDPKRAIAAYHRWALLYGEVLQGELRDEKGQAFSPSIPEAQLRTLGLPTTLPVVHDGVRILGVPVGNSHFCESFAMSRLDELTDDFETLERMPHLQSQFVIAQRSLSHRVTHLLRTLHHAGDPRCFAQCRAKYDDLMARVPRRVVGRVGLDARAVSLLGMPLKHGGIGLRSWDSVADCAFLASYINASYALPKLIPTLAGSFPDVRSLVRAGPSSCLALDGTPLLPAPSSHASAAMTSLIRLLNKAPSILSVLDCDDRAPRHIQHAISSIVETKAADTFALSLADPSDSHSERHMSHHLSSRGDAHSFGSTPTDAYTSHSNDNFSIMVHRRLHLPLPHQQEEEASRCPSCHKANVDHWGDHAVTCNATTKHKTKLWHDPLVRCSHFVCLTAGRRANMEVYGHQVHNNLRPDVVVFSPGCLPDIVCDVRTCNSTNHPQAASQEGYAADQAAKAKNRKWEPSCRSQGDRFVALAFEAGGRIGDPAVALFKELTWSSGGTLGELSCMGTWAFQRLHSANAGGVAALIRAQTPVPDGPCAITRTGVLSVGGSGHSRPRRQPLRHLPPQPQPPPQPPWGPFPIAAIPDTGLPVVQNQTAEFPITELEKDVLVSLNVNIIPPPSLSLLCSCCRAGCECIGCLSLLRQYACLFLY